MDIMAQKLGMDPAEFRMKNLIRPEQFPYTSAFGWEYDSGDYQTALNKAMETVDYNEAARGAEGKAGSLQARRDARADGHRRLLLHRDRRRRSVAQLRHSRHRHVRLRRDPHPSDRHRHLPARHQVARAGPRDHLCPDHRHRTRHCRRQHHGRGGQHRHRALRPRHLRLALDAGVRRRHRHGLPQDQGQGADDRRLHAGSARRRSRMGRRPLPREGQPRALQDHDRARLGGLSRGAARHGAGAGGGRLLRSAQLDLPVRRLYLRRRHRRRHRRRPRCGASTRSTIAAPASIR